WPAATSDRVSVLRGNLTIRWFLPPCLFQVLHVLLQPVEAPAPEPLEAAQPLVHRPQPAGVQAVQPLPARPADPHQPDLPEHPQVPGRLRPARWRTPTTRRWPARRTTWWPTTGSGCARLYADRFPRFCASVLPGPRPGRGPVRAIPHRARRLGGTGRAVRRRHRGAAGGALEVVRA